MRLCRDGRRWNILRAYCTFPFNSPQAFRAAVLVSLEILNRSKKNSDTGNLIRNNDLFFRFSLQIRSSFSRGFLLRNAFQKPKFNVRGINKKSRLNIQYPRGKLMYNFYLCTIMGCSLREIMGKGRTHLRRETFN